MCKNGEPRRILLALSGSTCPHAALFRAQSLSLLLDAELHVLRVMPPMTLRRRVLKPKVGSKEARRALTGLLDVRRRTRLLLSDALDNKLPKGRLKLRAGNFFAEVSARAEELSASLIVLAAHDSDSGHGRKVTRLARSIDVPVLVARDAGPGELILAATDLRNQAVPVLHRAAELSQRLGVPLIAVHNVSSGILVAGPELALPLALSLDLPVNRQRWRSPLEATHRLSVESEAVLRNELDPALAVLDEARTRDADLIVVGTRGRTWWERLLTRSVSAQVINRATRSVLVTPVLPLPACDAVSRV